MLGLKQRLMSKFAPESSKPLEEYGEDPDTCYVSACQLLDEIQAGGFENKAGLLEVHRLLQTALRKVPQEARFLIEMARLLYLLGDSGSAKVYLKQTLDRDPEHAEAQELFQYIEYETSLSEDECWARDLERFSALRFPKSQTEYDAFYERVLRFTQEQVRYLLQSEINHTLTLDEENSELQSILYQQTLAIKAQIEESLDVLEAEFETSEIRLQMRPLEQLQERLFKALHYNGAFQILQDGCEALQEEALQLLKQMNQLSEEEREAALNQLMEDCDALADDLDDIELETGSNLIMQEYERLLKLVQHLVDVFDEVQ